MLRKIAPFAIAGLLFGCAHTPTKTAPVKQRIDPNNFTPFDLYNCNPRKLTLPNPVNAAALTALWASAQPQVSECLVNPKSRGKATQTNVDVKFEVTDSAVNLTVTGNNLTPAGSKCIHDALMKDADIPTLPQGQAPVTAAMKIVHEVGKSPSVILGENDASDVAGMIRLAEPSMCECFAPWAKQPPEALRAHISFNPPANADSDSKTVTLKPTVTFEPTQDPAAQKVASCMQSKIAAIPFHVTTPGLSMAYPVTLINSGIDAGLVDVAPRVRFLQLDGIRGQKAANAAMAVAKRSNAVHTYDAAVRAYQKNHKAVSFDELKTKCDAMVQADKDWKTEIQAQVDVDNRTVELATQLAAQDPKWKSVVPAAQQQLKMDQAQLAKIDPRITKDQAVCPKEHY